MAARNKPAGIRYLVYRVGKGKVRIEGLSVSDLNQAEHEGLLGSLLAITDRERLVDPHGLVTDG